MTFCPFCRATIATKATPTTYIAVEAHLADCYPESPVAYS